MKMKDILKKSYDKSASVYDDKFSELQFVKYTNLLEDYLDSIKNAGEICDLGCGTGLLSDYLALKGIETGKMTGVDFSEEMLFYAKKKGLKCINSDILKLPFSENTFDMVFSFTVFRIIDIDFEEESDILRNISRILKPDGFFFISILAGKNNDMWYSILKSNGFMLINEINCGQDQGFVLVNKKCYY